MESKSLEEELYDAYYEQCEKDKGKGEHSKKMIGLGKYVSYGFGAVALGLGCLTYIFPDKNLDLESTIFGSGFTLSAAGIMVAHYEMKKIFEAMYRKNTGGHLNEKEIAEVKRAGKVGKYAYFSLYPAVLASVGVLMSAEPIFILASIPLFKHYEMFYKGVACAMFSASVDYIAAERRQLANPMVNPM